MNPQPEDPTGPLRRKVLAASRAALQRYVGCPCTAQAYADRNAELQQAQPNHLPIRDDLHLVHHLVEVGEADGDDGLVRLSADLCDLVAGLIPADGGVHEYARNTWLEVKDLWRSIPWGVAFHGNLLIDAYHRLAPLADEAHRERWRAAIARMCDWAAGNPVAGSFPLNCGIDLCQFAWRAGRLLGRPEVCTWALAMVTARLAVDQDADGLLHGENGGCSGYYTVIGGEFLAGFAWQSQDTALLAAADRLHAALEALAAPDGRLPGNFGTRTGFATAIGPRLTLLAASRGHGQARRRASAFTGCGLFPDWTLWQAGLASESAPAMPDAAHHFAAIELATLRGGGFQAWVGNYERSLWSRGLVGLWSEACQDFFCLPLHALPTAIESAKLSVPSDNADWAGFPHIRVEADGQRWDSQQEATDIALGQARLAWQERLLARDGTCGGGLRQCLTVGTDGLDIAIELTGLSGRTTCDFHILRRTTGFAGWWHGADADAAWEGRLARHGGWHLPVPVSSQDPVVVAQVGNCLLRLAISGLPSDTACDLAELGGSLHAIDGRTGGLRLRLAWTGRTALRFSLRLQARHAARTLSDHPLPGSPA